MNEKEKLLKATAAEIDKPKDKQLGILKKYLGSDLVDEWVSDYADDDEESLRERGY